jgi:hypothetical protein
MLRPHPALALLLLALGSVPSHAEFTLFKNIWGDVIVATDTTTAGRALTPPSPDQPVYYKGVSLGRKLGSIPGDREPDMKQLNEFVAGILAKQGYLAAPRSTTEPELFLVLQWGYIDPEQGGEDIGARTNPNMLGPEVFLTNFRSRATTTILEDTQHPIYGIIITAFEFKSARTTEPVVYWQTRIGLPTNGKSMADALPVMLVAAGPAIGRVADGPVLLDADRAREGRVKLGDLKFLDFEETPRVPKDEGGKN